MFGNWSFVVVSFLFISAAFFTIKRIMACREEQRKLDNLVRIFGRGDLGGRSVADIAFNPPKFPKFVPKGDVDGNEKE